MLILVGPSASGKTEIANILIKKYNMKRVVTYTTRPIRVNEVDKVSYNFISVDEFISLRDKDEFVETTYYNGNYYGTRKKDISFEKIVILDPNGLSTFTEKMRDKVFSVYIDTAEAIRRKRMIERLDDYELIEKRIINDRISFNKKMIKTDFEVENENTTLDELANVIYNKYLNQYINGGNYE